MRAELVVHELSNSSTAPRPAGALKDQDQKELANGAVRFLAANYRLEKRQQISSATAPRVTYSHSLYRCRRSDWRPNTPSYLMSGTPEQFTLPCQLCERVRAAQFPSANSSDDAAQLNIGERTRRSRLPVFRVSTNSGQHEILSPLVHGSEINCGG